MRGWNLGAAGSSRRCEGMEPTETEDVASARYCRAWPACGPPHVRDRGSAATGDKIAVSGDSALPPPHRYAGFLCGSCARVLQAHGPLQTRAPEPDAAPARALLFVMFFLAVGFWFRAETARCLGDAITTMSIGMTFLQIIASTASVSIIDWPPEVTYVLISPPRDA